MKDIKVKVGQIWKDNDPRYKNSLHGDTLKRIIYVGERYCLVMSSMKGFPEVQTKIRIDRFRNNNRGYVLISNPSTCKDYEKGE